MRHSSIIFGGLLMAAALAVPAVAKPPPAGVWEQFHFKDAKGRVHTVTEPVQIVRADYADKACGEDLKRGGAAMARFEVSKHPELAAMSFVGADCATDRTGKIKIAVGAWPAGGK